jgi:hypothetical protein
MFSVMVWLINGCLDDGLSSFHYPPHPRRQLEVPGDGQREIHPASRHVHGTTCSAFERHPRRASGAWVYVCTRVGFDNAHQVKSQKGKATDYRHRHRSVKPYAYRDAAALVADFWSEVEAVMREEGVWS